MKINILGTEYEIIIKKYGDDEAFERHSIRGYCDEYSKQIVVCNPATFAGWEHESAAIVSIAQKETIRHEIVHAFLRESGLIGGSICYDAGWATNEEMIDWIALQFPKMLKAMAEAQAL